MAPHRPGDPALLRELWRGKVWSVRPVTVVRDTPEVVALYIAPGTRWKRPVSPGGERLRLPADRWLLADDVWRGAVLRLTRPGDAHSTLVLWDSRGRFTAWYLNMEEPLRPSPAGFDYMDQTLDIVVKPDLKTWSWKDEDEMEEALGRGIYSLDQAAEIRAQGETALQRLLSREPPVDEPWERWQPDARWQAPVITPGWDIV